jgi:hypothetical protein
MIDAEDPQLVEGLLYCIRKRHEVDDDSNAGKGGPSMPNGIPRRQSSSNFKGVWGQDSDMTDFLGISGAPKAKLQEAHEKLKSRKITPKEQREFHQWLYSEVTPEKLRDPDFNLDQALEKISAYLDTTEKVRINARTIFGGP